MRPDFYLESEDASAFQKTYRAALPPCDTDVTVCAEAEEMAELFVNGQFCGVSFWTPHRFRIPLSLTGGRAADLRLVVTGSRANRYGNPVRYGLKEK